MSAQPVRWCHKYVLPGLCEFGSLPGFTSRHRDFSELRLVPEWRAQPAESKNKASQDLVIGLIGKNCTLRKDYCNEVWS
jgi:hypothetical protein